MISELVLIRKVVVDPEKLDNNDTISRRYIITQLLEDLRNEKAHKDLGYFLSVTGLTSISNKEKTDDSSKVSISVMFKCRTFMPCVGEIMEGVVNHMYRLGVFLKCGPMKYAFLSFRKMPNYRYVPGENQAFVNDQLDRIENNVVVRFRVLDVRWVERGEKMMKEFAILATLEGESLGPVSLSGNDEIDS